MVHGITFLKCKNGHILPISFDSNECGCHHKGKPCIVVTCSGCLEEYMKNRKGTTAKDYDIKSLVIPLDGDGMNVINKLLKKKGDKLNDPNDCINKKCPAYRPCGCFQNLANICKKVIRSKK